MNPPSPSRPSALTQTPTLPQWEHLPPARRRELAATLATLILKCRPTPQSPAEVPRE